MKKYFTFVTALGILPSFTIHSGGKPAQPDVESAARGRDSNFAKKKFFLGAGTAKLKIL